MLATRVIGWILRFLSIVFSVALDLNEPMIRLEWKSVLGVPLQLRPDMTQIIGVRKCDASSS